MKNINLIESVKTNIGDSKIESFTAEYNDKTLVIKMLDIRYNVAEAVLVLISDVTENIKFQNLKETNDYKNNLFASFTHEFKTPLNCLFVMLHKLSIEETISQQIKENFIKPAFYTCQNLSNLVFAVSDYTLLTLRKFKLEKKQINLKEFINETLDGLIYQAERKGLTVQLIYDDLLPESIITDARRLQQILFQLYSNAIKFTFNGTIKVKVKSKKPLENSLIKISVCDTGIGMREEDKVKLEECLNENKSNYLNFMKVSTNSIGVSLGLSLSYKIAQILACSKGEGIRIKSKLNVGSKFSFFIKNNLRENSKELTKIMTFQSVYKENSELSFLNNAFEKSTDSPFLKKPNEKKISSLDHLPEETTFFSSSNFNERYGFSFISYENKTPMLKCEHEPVLIVDDDEFNILALSTLLNTKKIKALTAPNGKIAIEIIKDQCDRRKNCCKAFKLIFMDLNMPVLNGVDTTIKLKEMAEKGELPFIPIIACTAFESVIEKSTCTKAGMIDYTTKPLNIKKISEIIKKYLF